MAGYHEIPQPPVFRGTEAERWSQLQRYLNQLREHLEHIINNMTKEGEKDNG